MVPTAVKNVPRRGRGRPRKILTGLRGRPKKEYNVVNRTEHEEEFGNMAEVPIQEAIKGPDAEEWYIAMTDEIESILINDTWKLIKRPKDRLVIGSRLVLRNKFKSDGTLGRRKARLVAQGFTQKPGIHFNETFAPVARMSSIRTLTALAAQSNMKMHQFDVTTAYLHGNVDVEVLMEPPKQLSVILERIVKKNTGISRKAEEMINQLRNEDSVCLLKKSLYGLKQAGRCWYNKLNSVLKSIGAIPTKADPCVYLLKRGEEVTYIITYVDDILVSSHKEETISYIFRRMSKELRMVDLGEVKYCLGIEFSRDGNQIRMNQRGYIMELLNRFRMTDSNPVMTPLDPNQKLTKCENTSARDGTNCYPYRELIGALTYLSTSTRPDICHAVSYLGQFNHCFDKAHLTAAKRVLRYLKGTSDLGLCYSSNSKKVNGFADADWGGDISDRKSFSGYCFIWANSPISWESKKQRSVALSSNEAEYMALSDAAKEAIYLGTFLREMNMDPGTIVVSNDNQGALKLSENPVIHARSKHIDIRYHFVRQQIKDGIVCFKYVPTNLMVADVLTKGLNGPKHKCCVEAMGLKRST